MLWCRTTVYSLHFPVFAYGRLACSNYIRVNIARLALEDTYILLYSSFEQKSLCCDVITLNVRSLLLVSSNTYVYIFVTANDDITCLLVVKLC